MGELPNMTDAEVAAHIRAWAKNAPPSPFAWPTDGCGYDQHLRFVAHRNARWNGGSEDEWRIFVLEYADALDREARR